MPAVIDRLAKCQPFELTYQTGQQLRVYQVDF